MPLTFVLCRAWNPEPCAVLSVHSPVSHIQPPHPCLYSNLREADILFLILQTVSRGLKGLKRSQPRRARWGPDIWIPFSQPKFLQESLHLQSGRGSKLTRVTPPNLKSEAEINGVHNTHLALMWFWGDKLWSHTQPVLWL